MTTRITAAKETMYVCCEVHLGCLAFQNLKRINHARRLDGCHGSYMSRHLIQSVVCCVLLAMLLMKEIKLTVWVFSPGPNRNIHIILL